MQNHNLEEINIKIIISHQVPKPGELMLLMSILCPHAQGQMVAMLRNLKDLLLINLHRKHLTDCIKVPVKQRNHKKITKIVQSQRKNLKVNNVKIYTIVWKNMTRESSKLFVWCKKPKEKKKMMSTCNLCITVSYSNQLYFCRESIIKIERVMLCKVSIRCWEKKN